MNEIFSARPVVRNSFPVVEPSLELREPSQPPRAGQAGFCSLNSSRNCFEIVRTGAAEIVDRADVERSISKEPIPSATKELKIEAA